MTSKRSLFIFAAAVFFSTACGEKTAEKQEAIESEAVVATPADNSRTSLDWAGTYKGTTPCADCDGIETVVTLYPDGRYRRTMTYLGKSDEAVVDEGVFEWNEQGSGVTLISESGTSQAYQVGENVLFHLDAEGKRIMGELEEMYKLNKNHSNMLLESKKWELSEFMGQPVEAKEGGKKAFITFSPVDGRMAGNDGCNNMMGSYELKEGGRISFGQMAGTLMACPDMTGTDEFRAALERVDNYNVSDTLLTLNKARMAPLARFVPVEE